MIYAQFGFGSDVYVCRDTGTLRCHACKLHPNTQYDTTDPGAMVRHLAEHTAAGHHVPATTPTAVWHDATPTSHVLPPDDHTAAAFPSNWPCAHCDHLRAGHGRRYAALVGAHHWTPAGPEWGPPVPGPRKGGDSTPAPAGGAAGEQRSPWWWLLPFMR